MVRMSAVWQRIASQVYTDSLSLSLSLPIATKREVEMCFLEFTLELKQIFSHNFCVQTLRTAMVAMNCTQNHELLTS